KARIVLRLELPEEPVLALAKASRALDELLALLLAHREEALVSRPRPLLWLGREARPARARGGDRRGVGRRGRALRGRHGNGALTGKGRAREQRDEEPASESEGRDHR